METIPIGDDLFDEVDTIKSMQKLGLDYLTIHSIAAGRISHQYLCPPSECSIRWWPLRKKITPRHGGHDVLPQTH
jgi:hypothetical protein